MSSADSFFASLYFEEWLSVCISIDVEDDFADLIGLSSLRLTGDMLQSMGFKDIVIRKWIVYLILSFMSDFACFMFDLLLETEHI